MCGRYRLARKKEILAETFDVENDVDWTPRYNVAPGQDVAVVRQDASQPVRTFSLVRWGLIPPWSKDAKAVYKMINARAETVADTPAFRDPFRSRRCLIPANAFYEWLRHEAACVIVRRAPLDRTCHPIGSTLRGVAFRKRIV